jgi:hypothetical protein
MLPKLKLLTSRSMSSLREPTWLSRRLSGERWVCDEQSNISSHIMSCVCLERWTQSKASYQIMLKVVWDSFTVDCCYFCLARLARILAKLSNITKLYNYVTEDHSLTLDLTAWLVSMLSPPELW